MTWHVTVGLRGAQVGELENTGIGGVEVDAGVNAAFSGGQGSVFVAGNYSVG